MKPCYSVVFVIGVLLGLATLCVLFPANGIDVFGIHLRFPSLQDVICENAEYDEDDDEEAEVEISPEELLDARLTALKAERMEEFMQYAMNDPARLFMPNDDMGYLDDFFDMMENAGKRHLRILHYGDSQIECDRITSFLRQEFQQEFGGMGVGLIPAWQTVPTLTTRQTIDADSVNLYIPYGPRSMRGVSGDYGIMAKCTHVMDGATITVNTAGGKDYSSSSRFNKMTILTRGVASVGLLGGDSIPLQMQQSGNICFYQANFGRGVSGVKIKVNGEADILGIQLDSDKGINIDNIPMRGCSGQELLTVNRESLAPFFQRENVGLIILQYGGNAVPYMSTTGLAAYKKRIQDMIRMFQQLEPKAKILFVGPADMANVNDEGEMKTYPIIKRMVDTLRVATNEQGVAYWDMYRAMGGKGSIVKWVDARPQLAGSDYVHFTPLGAKKMAHMLYETLQFYYRFYRFRTGKDELTTDSICSEEL